MKIRNDNAIARIWIFLITSGLSISAFSQKPPIKGYGTVKIKTEDSVHLIKSWKGFVRGIQLGDYNEIKELSLKEIYCTSLGHIWPGFMRAQSVPIDSFINVALIRYRDQHFIDVITDSTYQISAIKYQDQRFVNPKLKSVKKLILYDIYYIDYVPVGNGIRDQNYYIFRFVKIKGKYKFFGLDLAWPSAIKQ